MWDLANFCDGVGVGFERLKFELASVFPKVKKGEEEKMGQIFSYVLLFV